MKWHRPIFLRLSRDTWERGFFVRCARHSLLALLVITGSISACAKDALPAAIVLFDGTAGPAYIQLTGVTLNGKTEVRLCEGVSKFDRSDYNVLPRASFIAASSLERGEDGVLRLTVNSKAICAVPSNLKFDKKSQFTPAEAAEEAVLQGTPVPIYALSAGMPPFKPGVQLVFVTAPDFELADFLRAQRASTVKDWQDFMARYPVSGRVPDARKGIAELHEKAAEGAFAQYQQPGGANQHDIAMLRQASVEVQAANQASAGYEPGLKLTDTIARELDHLLEADRARLQWFQKALADHTPGYSHLAAARVHVEQLLTVRPDYAPVIDLRREIAREEKKLEVSVVKAESLKASGRFDDAVSSLGPYNSFASEIPRIDVVVDAAYRYHLDRGQKLAARQDWEQAVAEVRAATAIRPDSKEASAALNNATLQLSAKHDQEQAKLAVAKSDDFASKNEYVEAYEVLANLPDNQRLLVASQLAALKSNYVSAATRRAQKVQEVHIPIRGRADEDAVREAYALLDRVSTLTGDPAVTLKRDFLSSKISAHYLDQASRYLQKPSGSGAGVGWLYLREAQRYGITNLESVKDQMVRYAPLYQRRARLSVGVVLRDQTSRSAGPGFAEQLADALANGLESSGVGVVVVRKPSESVDALQPNFMLVGEVLEHRVIKTEAVEAPLSKYRAGTHETKNPEWLQAQTDYQSAREQLVAAQQALSDAQSQHKKKDIVAAANQAVQIALTHADELKYKLKMTDENRVEAIIEPYHYTKKAVDLAASIELAFHITDRSGNVIGQPVNIHKSNHKTAVVLQDVKPEDTEGITNQSVEPDQAQFLSDLEIEARDAMVNAVREKASALPPQFLQEARNHAQRGDLDGAAEQYVMYLNSTSETAPARDEAVNFLRDRFNLAAPAGSKL
jgi:hypothetical protein